MNTPVRHNPLGALDTDEDDQVPAPQPRKPKLPKEEAERIARQQGFAQGPAKESALVPTSASAPRRGRRRVTGRTHQINIKTTEAAIEQFYKLADEMRAPLGEVLEQALEALEKARK